MVRRISEQARPPHIVNHVGLVLDQSTSMDGLQDGLIKAVDALVDSLAQDSQALGQETRVSIWAFSKGFKNLIWDMDVLHLPSIKDLYQIDEPYTALISATIKSIDDFRDVPQKYGDHAFLLYLFTDGQENASQRFVAHNHTAGLMSATLNSLPNNWTVAAFVPDASGVRQAKYYGFAAGNIKQWDVSETGVSDVGEVMKTVTRSYMTSRASGTRSTNTLFADSSVVNAASVQANLKPADPASYILHYIPPATSPFPKALKNRKKYRLDDYITNVLGRKFVVGTNYYELIKSEEVQPNKDIAVVNRKTKQVFIGREARDLIGLSSTGSHRLRPGHNDEFAIFVRSDSTNRNMLEGQMLLVVK